MFTVPASSSPPSTPDYGSRKSRNFFSPSNNPSTTPAGPPPTSLSHKSTTPAGPPPSSVFGSAPYDFPAAASFAPDASRSSPLRHVAAASHSHVEAFDAMDEDHDMLSFRDSVLDDQQNAQDLSIRAVARGLAKPPAKLHESADIVLTTELVLQKLWIFQEEHLQDQNVREAALAVAVQDLLVIWKSVADPNIQIHGVGPGNAASALSKSVFLVSLLLTFHHPPRKEVPPNQFRRSRDLLRKPIPEALLDWLRDYHDIFPEDYAEVMSTEHGPAAHERFWDTVFSLSLRGRLKDVSHMLKEADFGHAASALDDGAAEPGYLGKQLGNVQRVVSRAVTVLDSCPAAQSGDWNVKGSEWAVFRQRIRQALSDLETFAEGSSLVRQNSEEEEEEEELYGQGFGLSGMSNNEFSISKMSQRAQSQVPWTVYESLKQLYAQLLGMRLEIVSASADWVEAVIGLTVWWDGDQDDLSKKSLAASRRSLSRSQRPRTADLRPGFAYQEKLAHSLRQVMTEYTDPELHFNATEPVEVGLACIFDGDLEGLLGIVRGWSSTVSTAVVEIANFGSWLGQRASPSKRILSDLDQSDLMVLSYGQQEKAGVDPDRALIAYAGIVSKQPQLFSPRLQRTVQGWELAIQILNRVEDAATANRHIALLLDGLDLTSSESIEKIMKLCDELNLPQLGRKMAGGYASYLAENTSNYGSALFYYARAHQAQKIKEVLNVLISSCLVHSRAFPAAGELDKQLRSIVASPNETLEQLAAIDNEAAEILSKQLSGYATLRKFYDLRDEQVNLQEGQNVSMRPLARKRHAASALVAVIMSAADSIHGGLLDESVESVVQVDGLLVLLGEALMFLNQPKRFLDARQIFALMKAAEDVSTVSGTVFSRCQDCLNSALAAAKGSEVASPQALLKKSTSSLAASSQFSLINSATTASSQSNGSLDGSAVVVKGKSQAVKRAWDWRGGLARGTNGSDVVNILRLGLAKELSRTWTEGDFGDVESL